MSLISMKNVSLRRGDKQILEDINWEVEKGQTWVLLGLNGAGKSTLLRLIMAEIWRSSGQMTVLGTEFGKGNIPALREKIGVVGSFIAERFPPRLFAEKIVLTGKYKSSILYKEYSAEELEEARDMLRFLGGEHLIGRLYATLSQGEKQLILIARSLMASPEILILDEATSGLDLFARERLLKQVDRITHLPKAPLVIYVTHHAEEITTDMTHILLLKEGKAMAQGPKTDIMTPETLSQFYSNPVSIIPIDEGRYYVKPEV